MWTSSPLNRKKTNSFYETGEEFDNGSTGSELRLQWDARWMGLKGIRKGAQWPEVRWCEWNKEQRSALRSHNPRQSKQKAWSTQEVGHTGLVLTSECSYLMSWRFCCHTLQVQQPPPLLPGFLIFLKLNPVFDCSEVYLILNLWSGWRNDAECNFTLREFWIFRIITNKSRRVKTVKFHFWLFLNFLCTRTLIQTHILFTLIPQYCMESKFEWLHQPEGIQISFFTKD